MEVIGSFFVRIEPYRDAYDYTSIIADGVEIDISSDGGDLTLIKSGVSVRVVKGCSDLDVVVSSADYGIDGAIEFRGLGRYVGAYNSMSGGMAVIHPDANASVASSLYNGEYIGYVSRRAKVQYDADELETANRLASAFGCKLVKMEVLDGGDKWRGWFRAYDKSCLTAYRFER